MSKIANMLSILWLLEPGKRVTAHQLAEQLEINVRTVYRYIDSLCASGVPIIADAGHNGGYSLLHEFTKAPLFFDLDEQKSLIHAAKFAQEAGYPFSDVLNRALEKLKLYTNPEQLEQINRHTVGFDVIRPPADPSSEPILQMVEKSVADGYTLSMDYHSGHGHTPQQRNIDPYGLVYWKGKWYVVAHCHIRDDIRSFRIDRIKSVSLSGERFHRPSGFSARAFFLEGLLPDLKKQEGLISVTIQGKNHALDDLCQHWLFGHALIERSDGKAHFKMEKESIHTYVPYFLLPYGKSITILEPTSLNGRLVEVTSELYNHYQKNKLH